MPITFNPRDYSQGKKIKLKAVATFAEEINDGLADYAPGDYSLVYDVTVQKKKEGA